ncbi:hypothetical protein [Acetanaerobacterium elongatum]|uniref:hypothetical protein n=1 Tax=Acetanaerobacterium elongatum TaxID=258515 RepID=UPI00115FF673|nr:hypothetical protein [Acetanaerobacterium elongatum]
MKAFGWLLSIGGGGFLIYALTQRDTMEYKWNSALGGDTATVNMVFYCSIAALILGVIFLLVGYLSKRPQQKEIQQIHVYSPQPQPQQYAAQAVPNQTLTQKSILCAKCNKLISTDDLFCPSCGEKK